MAAPVSSAGRWFATIGPRTGQAIVRFWARPVGPGSQELFQQEMPWHGLAVAAVRSAMWAAFYLRGVRPDRKMALDTMAHELGWATAALGDLFVAIDVGDEPSARHVTRVAAGYVELVRALAADRKVSAKRLGYRSIAAYRLILEKYPSRLDNPAQARPDAKRVLLKSSQ